MMTLEDNTVGDDVSSSGSFASGVSENCRGDFTSCVECEAMRMFVSDKERMWRNHIDAFAAQLVTMQSKIEAQEVEVVNLKSDIVFYEERLRFSAEQLRTVSLYMQALDSQRIDDDGVLVSRIPQKLTKSVCDLNTFASQLSSSRHGSLSALGGRRPARVKDDMDVPRSRRFIEAVPSDPSSLSGGDTPISGIGDPMDLRATYTSLMSGLRRLFVQPTAGAAPSHTMSPATHQQTP